MMKRSPPSHCGVEGFLRFLWGIFGGLAPNDLYTTERKQLEWTASTLIKSIT